ncbi:MAG TPA: hypothetical protein EYP14_07175, partial [Planctomycetaceae bacterium]|nr:hypothetical protein [Planctomycetaceae bacterium]
MYQKSPIYYYYNFHQFGHTMDYVLRQGESFTRWWEPRGGRWRHLPEYNKAEWLVRLLARPPRGPKPNHRHFSVHNHGNGLFVYEPDLSERSDDFFDGVAWYENVRPSAAGLTLANEGSGFAVFEIRSPYIIVPLVKKLHDFSDDREASVVTFDGERVRLAISLDNGQSWQPVSHEGGRSVIDLSKWVSGRYGYLLRFELSGRPDESLLRHFTVRTWVQVAPASLPALRKGRNEMQLVAGDHYGLPTRVVELRSEAGRRESLLKLLVEPPEDYDPARHTARVRGEIIARAEAPPGATIAWFSAGASFRTYQGERAKRTKNTIAYAVDRPEHFVEIYRANVPAYCNHWHY